MPGQEIQGLPYPVSLIGGEPFMRVRWLCVSASRLIQFALLLMCASCYEKYSILFATFDLFDASTILYFACRVLCG